MVEGSEYKPNTCPGPWNMAGEGYSHGPPLEAQKSGVPWEPALSPYQSQDTFC